MLYIDSSALVKVVIEEAHSQELDDHLAGTPVLATSRLALVEVPRATSLANPSEAVRAETERLLASCLLVGVSDLLLRNAATLTSREIRTLDAIHLASALHVGADEFVAYDRRLLEGAAQHGLSPTAPGRQ